ncbi:MAG: pyridoxal phosphate-dependent aminotransferase [Gemmatimonadaceae bacterium]
MSRLSRLSQTLRHSSILSIAAEVKALQKEGRQLLDFTVGDFSSKQFRIPIELENAIVDALRAGETTYPPSVGVESLREAVRQFYRRRLGLEFPIESVLIASGARPAIYGVYRALVDQGDKVVFAVPSWNNDYYTDMVGATAVTVECDARTRFLPTASALRPLIRGARLLALNSPLNPTGTVFDARTLTDICDVVLEENARRESGERPLFVMYDQVYWMLTVGGAEHVNPISLRPEISPYVVLVDAISKAFASTGLRVGWAVAPPDIIKPMNAIIGHVGAWAPRAEQIATTTLLNDSAAVDTYIEHMRSEVAKRLDAVHDVLTALQREGLPVECVRPEGAIYVSARFALHGMRTPEGTTLDTDEDVRRYLLNASGLAAVPFSAFGAQGDAGWFRLSIGTVSVAQIEGVAARVRVAIEALASAAVSS